jgi:nicotinate-nucleotide adenylyltransferase
MRIGIVGGSFNPIHIAHLIIADRFVEQMRLDTCTFIPAYQSPFKVHPNTADATPVQRMDMVRAAIALNGSFSASDAEIQRGGVSYTIDTVEDLRKQHPTAELFLLIGSDQAIEFVRWHRWEDICRSVHVCIVRRPFLLTNEMELRTTERLTVDGRAPIWINAPLLEISSTEIRRRVSEGATINYLTVKAVRDYIERHGLYRCEYHD